MCSGAKQKTKQTSTYTPTAEASGLYSNVIDQATAAAGTPYNPATQQQVAGLTPDQLAAFQAVTGQAGAWTPYTDKAFEATSQAAGPISAEAIKGYMDPYMSMVISAALDQSNRQNAVQQAQLKGNSVASGALGGNAPGVAAAQLAGEQGRNTNSLLSSLLSGGYSQALNAAQSDAARRLAAGAQFGQLGQTVQGLGLTDIMAQLQAGNQQQAQTQSELDAATANAQAETMWPYQNAQWLASIAGGVGPLTGGTTTGSATTQQGKGIGQVIGGGLAAFGALSDRRAKKNVREVGRTHDGQPLYSFEYLGSDEPRIGLMADQVEKSHPEAVGRGPWGLKTVDYDAALADSSSFASGGAAWGSSGSGSYFPWAELRPTQAQMPQLAPASWGGQQQDPLSNPEEAVKLGKSARAGISNVLRQLDPAKGWGASVEPLSGSGGGGLLSGLGSLFGFADGGGVDMAFLSPDVMAPYGIRPRARYRDSYAGEVGPALRDESVGEVGNPPQATPWYQRSLTDLLGITSGRTDPSASLSFPRLEDEELQRWTENHAPLQDEPPSPWSLDGGTIRYNGRSLADVIAGRSPGEAAPAPGSGEMRGAPAPFDTNLEDVNAPAVPGITVAGGDEAVPMELGADVLAPQAPPAQAPEPEGGPFDPLDFIRQEEGYREQAYPDRGQYSVGYGSRGRKGERITRAEAERRLWSETREVDDWITRNVKVPLTDRQRAGLLSFGYNLGTDDLDKLKGDINAGDWGRVGGRMLTFNKARNDAGALEEVGGLTSRRTREAALVSGGSSLPASPGLREKPGVPAFDAQTEQLVAAGKDPQAPARSSYSGAQDRQAGGILQSLFGVDFNPLKLSEDERMALVVAGLSMMSTGNVGAGGLAGVKYLTDVSERQRKASAEAAKLGLELYKTRSQEARDLYKIEAEAMKPTDAQRDYRIAKQEGFEGTLMDFLREKTMLTKAGNTPAEVAARVGLADAFQADLPAIRKGVQELTTADRVDIPLRRGRAGDLWRRIESGTEAMKRMMTGAGMSMTEAQNYVDRYQISATDRVDTMLRKLDLLSRDLEATKQGIIAGRPGAFGGAPAATAAPSTRRYRATNGRDTVEWNGRAWVPAGASP